MRLEWEALDENTKFFRTHEDPFKEASIRFIQAPDAEEDAPNPALQQTNLEGESLRKFESAVCDARGMWVYFDKVVPQDEEAEAADPKAKGKKAPAKGKPASATEETRPTYGRAWVNLTPLMHPGATKMTQRVFLNQI